MRSGRIAYRHIHDLEELLVGIVERAHDEDWHGPVIVHCDDPRKIATTPGNSAGPPA